jgi:DNA mismatch repair protein MutS2
MFLNLFKDNIEALNLLDWSQITRDISSLSHFELTQKKLSHAPKIIDTNTIQSDLDLLEQYILNFDSYSYTFNSQMRSIPESEEKFYLISELKKGKLFEANELNFFALLIENYINCFSIFKELKLSQNFDFSRDELSPLRRNFLNPLREFVNINGSVSYESHPLLRKLNQEMLTLEQDLRNSIIRLSKNEPFSSRLQMENFDIVNDRYVLAIKSDSYNSNLGLIIARSQSGMTLFVEPFEMREKSNRRMQLLSEIEAIVLKLTNDLSKIAYQHADLIYSLSRFPLEIDWLNTKATYSIKLGLSKPILSTKFSIEMRGLFHPLIKNPVKNNIELKNNNLGLIISGPNTGGKTVALKSISLSYLFLNLGLYLPASFAEVYPVPGLFYFSHDHQNLSEGLSSFASESMYYLKLLEQLEPNNLIIIDEIFNSTSSEEASALAMAFLDEIHNRSNSKVIISTHHQVLKTFMHSRPDYISGHVGFDFELNRPTYKLITGEPGSSLAFQIFDNLSLRFGVTTSISKNAKQFLDHKQVSYETLLQELSSKKIELDKLIINNRQLNIDLKNQKSSMEGVLFLEKEKIFNEYNKKIKNIFNEAESLISQIKEEKITNKRNLDNQIAKVQSSLNQHASVKSLPKAQIEIYDHLLSVSIEQIKTPMTLFSITLRKNIIATNVNQRKNEVQIKNGALSIWVNPQTLRFPSGTKAHDPIVKIFVDRAVRGDIEIDCRGMRLDEFQKTCEQALDEVVSGEIPFVTIIHGHGDGILKKWLRDHLNKNFKELNWSNIEGNDGCTKISF